MIERWVRTATAGGGCAPYRSHTSFMDLIADQNDPNESAPPPHRRTHQGRPRPGRHSRPGKRGIRPARRADRAHIAPTEELFLAINSRSSSMLFALVRGVTGADVAAQKSVSEEFLIRGLSVRSPRAHRTHVLIRLIVDSSFG